MEERKGDPRMYPITCFLLLCIISGGVLIGLYMFLPEEFSGSGFAAGGLVLISIPWIFWLIAYIYNCFAPPHGESQINAGSSKHLAKSAVASPQGSSPRAKTSTTITAMTTATNESGEESPDRCSNAGRHVQFGGVTVLGSEEIGNADDIENGQKCV